MHAKMIETRAQGVNRAVRVAACAGLAWALVQAAPVFAQDVEAFEAPDPDAPPVVKPAFSVSFQLAPDFTSDLTQTRGERLQDANATSQLLLNFTTDPNAPLVLSGSAGVKWATDFENGDEEHEQSSIVGTAKLNWNRGFRRISPFVSYSLEDLHNDVLGSDVATDHSLSLGADVVLFGTRRCLAGEVPSGPSDRVNNCTGAWGWKVTLVPSIDRLESSDPTRERYTPRLQAKFDLALTNGISFRAAGDYQHRIFDSTLAGRRTQDRFLVSGGVNFAGLVQGGPVEFKELFIGGQWLSVQEGTVDDVSKLSFLPMVRINIPLGG